MILLWPTHPEDHWKKEIWTSLRWFLSPRLCGDHLVLAECALLLVWLVRIPLQSARLLAWLYKSNPVSLQVTTAIVGWKWTTPPRGRHFRSQRAPIKERHSTSRGLFRNKTASRRESNLLASGCFAWCVLFNKPPGEANWRYCRVFLPSGVTSSKP